MRKTLPSAESQNPSTARLSWLPALWKHPATKTDLCKRVFRIWFGDGYRQLNKVIAFNRLGDDIFGSTVNSGEGAEFDAGFEQLPIRARSIKATSIRCAFMAK
jgi:hypothetical protein